MKKAQEIAKRYVLPWLRPEQEEAEPQYRRVSPRFVEIGNNFLKKLAEGGIPELARMPHALDPETGFRVRSSFAFADFIQVAEPVSPLRWLADVLLSFIGALWFIKNDGREFLVKLLEVNSVRVQSDILNRIQESHGRLEVEIRRLLHEVSRVAEHALSNARSAYDRLDVTNQLLNQSNRALDLAQTRYKLGQGSIVELSQAQLQQTQAEISQAQAGYEYRPALAVLRYQTSGL
jgi:hypothetical protein